ncbi:unnamed protein product [Adineta ricciae]|uniref:Uncharacterized protein n=1 Tax=Adineta ricciae TaxID=249248 RepID=A0A815XUI2_ADIRI|nr:unnamed protein product [Adineta ricciae]CAF1562193.1 unnamed protein product [Adineta ricciae]
MSLLDFIPGVSQVKSLVHLAAGDEEGAKRTQDRFFTKTPIVAHCTAGVAKVCGDHATAKQCWEGGNSSLNSLPVVGHTKGLLHYAVGDVKNGNKAMEMATSTSLNMMDSVPVVGHAKAVVHYALDDKEGGDRAMVSATRTTAVTAAGALGFVIAGPPGAALLGIDAGVGYDCATMAVTDGKQVNGICQIIEKPTDVDSYFNAGMSVVGDGLTGYAGGKVAERYMKAPEISTAENLRAIRQKKGFAENSNVATGKNGKEIFCEAKDMQTGKTYSGVNESVREIYGDPAPRPNEFLRQHPNIETPLKRHPASCAEAQALHKVVESQSGPNLSTAQVRLTTVEVRPNGDIYSLPRCENCTAYKDVVGSCTTDVKPFRVPRSNEYLTKGGAAYGTAATMAAKHARRRHID